MISSILNKNGSNLSFELFLLILFVVHSQPFPASKSTFLSQLFDFGSKTEERTLKVCPSEIKDREFLIIGHSGGDSHQACENTIAATEAALQRSILSSHGKPIRNNYNSIIRVVKCLVNGFERFRDT